MNKFLTEKKELDIFCLKNIYLEKTKENIGCMKKVQQITDI